MFHDNIKKRLFFMASGNAGMAEQQEKSNWHMADHGELNAIHHNLKGDISMDNQIQISIFWTGGYDSTFRICQLSRKNVTITPYYLSDNRPSEQMELQAINKIRDKLMNHPNTIAAINPLQYVSKNSRKSDSSVTDAFNRLLSLQSLRLILLMAIPILVL